MKWLRLTFSVIVLFLLANCQLCDYFDFCKKKHDSYKVKKFYEKNKNNEKLALFKDHDIFYARNDLYVLDGLQILVSRAGTTIKIPGTIIKYDERSKFYKRTNDILEGEEKEEYLKIFREYKKLSVMSIHGGQTDGYVQIEVIPDHIYLYVVDHHSFNLDEYIKRRKPKDLKKIDDSWYYYYRHKPE
jgi:hypothetical protein